MTHHKELPTLTLDEATELLRIHGGSCEDPYDERMETGLIYSFRAWNGKPNSENFRQVMACIKALGPTWSAESIPRRPLSDLVAILHLGLSYVSDPRRKQHRKEYVLEPSELELEDRWLDCIGYAVMAFLQCDDEEEAFSHFNAFLDEQDRAGE